MQATLPTKTAIEAERARRDFALFAKLAWHIIEPGKAYISGWHLDAIAEHLQAVIEGQIKRLLVNMPPRHGKSSYISTLIHPWSWLQNPSLRWLCASYALNLATRDNLKCRRIIKSKWWQDRYGHLFELTKDQDAKMKFENNFSGYRQAVSVGAAGTTGEGGDILCMLYNTDVTTDKGRLKIGDIVERKLPVRILAFDHETNSPRWQSIEKYEVHPGRSCVRVTFSDGRTVDATTDHPFYVIGKGYIPAAELTHTDEVITDEGFLSNLRERNRPSARTPGTRQKGHILQSRLPRHMADRREQSRISGRENARNGRAETGVEVLSVRCIEPIPTPEHVYNLCVAEDHNYYANGILVHNCIDDPHPIEQKRSDIKREAVLDWFLNTWMSRLNDEASGAMIVVGQRVHSQDVSGLIIEGAAGGEWTQLNLPAEYETANPSRTYFPQSGKTWQDPRTEEGELLWEEKFPRPVIEQKKRIHGPLGFAAIYQQRPVPAGGTIYKEKDRRFFTIDQLTQSYLLETPRGRVTFPIDQCWNLGVIDLATSLETKADYFCFETWAITPYKDGLLLDALHDHLDFPEQQKQIPLKFQRFHHSVIAVEKAGYQLAMIQHLVSQGFPIKPFTVHADKIVRSTTGSIFYSNGKAYHLKDLINLQELEKELFTFPKAPHDDYADCHAMMAIVVPTAIRPGLLDLDSDTEEIDTTLSIEQILVAEAITAEQKLLAEEEAKEAEKELFKKGPQINPFEWAETHEGGWE